MNPVAELRRLLATDPPELTHGPRWRELAQAAIDALDAKWIPVAERLPEKATAVLIVCGADDPDVAGEVEFAERRRDGEWFLVGGVSPIGTPTHWQPLPAAPGQRP